MVIFFDSIDDSVEGRLSALLNKEEQLISQRLLLLHHNRYESEHSLERVFFCLSSMEDSPRVSFLLFVAYSNGIFGFPKDISKSREVLEIAAKMSDEPYYLLTLGFARLAILEQNFPKAAHDFFACYHDYSHKVFAEKREDDEIPLVGATPIGQSLKDEFRRLVQQYDDVGVRGCVLLLSILSESERIDLMAHLQESFAYHPDELVRCIQDEPELLIFDARVLLISLVRKYLVKSTSVLPPPSIFSFGTEFESLLPGSVLSRSTPATPASEGVKEGQHGHGSIKMPQIDYF